MDKDNAPASQQIKQHYNQTQQAEKFTTKHIFSAANRRIFFGGFMATLQNSASRLKFGGYVSSISISTFCSILQTQTEILSNSRHHDMGVVNHLVIKGSELTVWFQVTEIRGGV